MPFISNGIYSESGKDSFTTNHTSKSLINIEPISAEIQRYIAMLYTDIYKDKKFRSPVFVYNNVLYLPGMTRPSDSSRNTFTWLKYDLESEQITYGSFVISWVPASATEYYNIYASNGSSYNYWYIHPLYEISELKYFCFVMAVSWGSSAGNTYVSSENAIAGAVIVDYKNNTFTDVSAGLVNKSTACCVTDIFIPKTDCIFIYGGYYSSNTWYQKLYKMPVDGTFAFTEITQPSTVDTIMYIDGTSTNITMYQCKKSGNDAYENTPGIFTVYTNNGNSWSRVLSTQKVNTSSNTYTVQYYGISFGRFTFSKSDKGPLMVIITPGTSEERPTDLCRLEGYDTNTGVIKIRSFADTYILDRFTASDGTLRSFSSGMLTSGHSESDGSFLVPCISDMTDPNTVYGFPYPQSIPSSTESTSLKYLAGNTQATKLLTCMIKIKIEEDS